MCEIENCGLSDYLISQYISFSEIPIFVVQLCFRNAHYDDDIMRKFFYCGSLVAIHVAC